MSKPWEETWEADLKRWEVRTPHVCDEECQDMQSGEDGIPGWHNTYSQRRLETDGGIYVGGDADRLRLIAAAPELYRALEAVEWAGGKAEPYDSMTNCCPSCEADDPGWDSKLVDGQWHNTRRQGKHAADCQLAAAIRKARGET